MDLENSVVLYGEMIAMNDLIGTITIELKGVSEPIKKRVILTKQEYLDNIKQKQLDDNV